MCVGPETAKNSLKNCLAVGGDYAYLVNDAGIESTDTLGVAEVLKGAIAKLTEEKGSFDLIFTGKEATDVTLGQTGIILAQKLGYAVITNVLEVETADGRVQAKQETEEGYRKIDAALPTVLTITKPAYDPRYPTIKNKMAARRKPIEEYEGSSLADNTAPKIALVAEYEPPQREAGVKIQEETVEESTAKAIAMMVEARVL